MKRVLLVGALLLALALGAGGGYYVGDYLDAPQQTTSGAAAPLGEVSPSPTPSGTPTSPSLPVKTPVPNNLEPLETGLEYTERSFTVTPKDQRSVRLSIEVPRGWRLKKDPKRPAEVKYLDKLEERGVRVEAVEPASKTPEAEMDQLVIDLKKSLPPQEDLRIVRQDTALVTGNDGEPRSVATLVYTYIPGETLRYVIVRWIAINGQLTNVEMSITGLPQDADGLGEILERASTSVSEAG